MIMFSSVREHQRAPSLVSAMILVAVLMLPLACASTGQKRRLNEVKSKVESVWILEEWHMKGEVVVPPKVASRFVIRDNAIVLIMLNRAGEPPWSYYGYGKYTLDASTFSMGFDETSFVKESSSGVTVSHKLLWDGKMMPFVISTENNQLHMRCDDVDYDIIVDGNTLILKIGGKIARTYRRAGIE
jgi:hypothetical protein